MRPVLIHWIPVLVFIASTGSAYFAPAEEAAQPGPSIVLVQRGGVQSIAVRNLPPSLLEAVAAREFDLPAWWRAFPVHAVVDADQDVHADQPNVLGRYVVEGGSVFFEPKYPLSNRVDYRVAFHPEHFGHEHKALRAVLRVEAPGHSAPAKVARVYPSSDVLPANLLKFYIEFSRPMSRGVGYEYIKLLRSDGTLVVDPFPAIGVELWGARQQRYTLLLDPGRIKRGIRINEEMGLPLVPGESYQLVVDAAWPDAGGKPLAEGFTKSFRVVEPVYVSPATDAWGVDAPKAGTESPLVLSFPQALDAALLERLIWLVDAKGKEVPGQVILLEKETRWHFVPAAPWAAGSYTLRIDARLEDLAGNQLRRPFELDLEKKPALQPVEEFKIPLTIR